MSQVDTAPLTFRVEPSTDPASEQDRASALADPGFGRVFTDHMVQATWTPQHGWHDGRVSAYGPIQLMPSAAVLHYAQEIFEGMKAYRHEDGSVWTFRPEANARRFARSAQRLALPHLPETDFVGSLRALVQVDQVWVPDCAGERSLYLRPFMYASEAFLGVRPAAHVTYSVIASPAGSYFPGGVKPVSIWLSTEYTRAAPGGTGAAKCGGNYAASLAAQVEATKNGCEQVVFLDGAERRFVEELGGMNIFLVHRDGHLVTPELNDSILEGVTRSSIMALAKDLGHDVEERRISAQEWQEGAAAGEIVEVFACGTAAVITPVGRLVWDGGEVGIGTAARGDTEASVTMAIRRSLVDIQYGRVPDTRGWLTQLA